MKALRFFVISSCAYGQVPSLTDLASSWQKVWVCDDDAPLMEPCGTNPFNHSHDMSFLMALDQGCCYKRQGGRNSGSTVGGYSYLPNEPRPGSSILSSVGFYGADQAVPSLSNRLGALHADWRGDLLGVTCFTAPPIGGPCEGWPGYSDTTSMPSNLMLDGTPLQLLGPMEYRWSAFEIERRVQIGEGVQVYTKVRMLPNTPITIFDLSISSTFTRPSHFGTLEMDLLAFARSYKIDSWPGSPANSDTFNSTQFSTTVVTRDGVQAILVKDKISGLSSAAAFDVEGAPVNISLINTSGTFAHATSNHILLLSNATWRIGLVWAVGENALEEALKGAHGFRQLFERTQDGWERWWHGAFETDSDTYPGNFPTLETDDPKLRRLYYSSLLSMLNTAHHIHNNLEFVAIQPVAAQTSLYMWDSSYVSTAWTLLDPDGLFYSLDTLLRGLGPNAGTPGLLNHSSVDLLTGEGQGAWYAFNEYSFFLAADNFARLTKPSVALQRPIAGATMQEWMEKAATGWKRLLAPGQEWLASYGSNENILEVAPNYAYVAPSLNFNNAWMMDVLAKYYKAYGNSHDSPSASQLYEWSQKVTDASLTLYAGEGVWACLWPDGKKVVRHILDFISIACAVGRQLPQNIRQDMLNFATSELRSSAGWMRALSLQDVMASWASTHRDDHGPFGAWDGWVAKSIEAYAHLGDWTTALEIAHDAAGATYEGPFGQAHHLLMPNNTWVGHRQRVHKSGDWLVGEYFALCGGMFAEAIISTLFGLQPPRSDMTTLPELLFPDESRGFRGTLSHVRVQGSLYTITSDSSGLSIVPESTHRPDDNAMVFV